MGLFFNSPSLGAQTYYKLGPLALPYPESINYPVGKDKVTRNDDSDHERMNR